MKQATATTLFVVVCLCILNLVVPTESIRRHGNSVSGVSSEGAAAVQYHVSFSSELIGAGIIAGVPYYCAEDNLVDALSTCMTTPSLISIAELIAFTTYAEGLFSIDSTYNLANQRVWLFSGLKDTVVNPGVMQKLQNYYEYYVNKENIEAVFNISAEHCVPTVNYGNPCVVLNTPFINSCDYDAAGQILAHIYGDLNPKTKANPKHIYPVAQSAYIPYVVTPYMAGLNPVAYVYIPENCSSTESTCDVHVAFHGCEQTIADVGDIFYTHAGYNDWAESNDIIILYPQVQTNALNPKGCWDWWGYTGPSYATQLGVQMATVRAMQKLF